MRCSRPQTAGMINNDGENGEQQPLDLTIEPAQRAGVWANWAQVSNTKHEFTIDFGRLDSMVPRSGIVVARVSMSPLFVMQLLDTLHSKWDDYVRKSMPQEVRDADISEDSDESEIHESEDDNDQD